MSLGCRFSPSRELLAGKKVKYPRLGPIATFKKAEHRNKKNPNQTKSLLDDGI